MDQQSAPRQPQKQTSVVVSHEIAVHATTDQVLKTWPFSPEQVYLRWTTSNVTRLNDWNGLVCHCSKESKTLRRWAIWRLYGQARPSQRYLEWSILDISMVLNEAIWRWNLEGLMWSLMHSQKFFAWLINWDLKAQQVWSVSNFFSQILWMCSKSTIIMLICNQARHCIWWKIIFSSSQRDVTFLWW